MLVRDWQGNAHTLVPDAEWSLVLADSNEVALGSLLVLVRPDEDHILFHGTHIACKNARNHVWEAYKAGRKTVDLEPIWNDLDSAKPGEGRVIPLRVLPKAIVAAPRRKTTTSKPKPRATSKGRGSRKGK